MLPERQIQSHEEELGNDRGRAEAVRQGHADADRQVYQGNRRHHRRKGKGNSRNLTGGPVLCARLRKRSAAGRFQHMEFRQKERCPSPVRFYVQKIIEKR